MPAVIISERRADERRPYEAEDCRSQTSAINEREKMKRNAVAIV
jgi:hypothetical protein